ncbi:MAG: DUF2330 domain-containing protein [Deltaproteobacteria bacterium]|jgi:MYXO-CTERM domain-containing protein
MTRTTTTLAALCSATALVMLAPNRADACGCFAPPDPSVPVVQAGERIVFAHEDGMVTAHIQIQYQGDASEFGWLLPLPAVPEEGLKLGVEELFSQIINTTQPKYRVDRITPDSCEFQFGGRLAGSFNDSAQSPPNAEGGEKLVVLQDSIGPYDYVVLDASTKDEMFDWLVENGYFIPTGTEDVVQPYIYSGAYFLALKLRKGNDVGDVQPVVLRYKADYAMIPIVLTSVAANPDMGIQVWVLGEHRAIPRNYRHTILNEEHIDWFNAGANYNDVVIAATNEATDGQSFVTEYAGSVEPMRGLLNYDGRFGSYEEIKRITDAVEFLRYMRQRGFTFGGALTTVLQAYFPVPAGSDPFVADDFYNFPDAYLDQYKRDRPEAYAEEYQFDPVELADKLWERIVVPTLDAGALFDKWPKMTRMYTTLSPDEMTRDPVFSFNPDLPDVESEHVATFTYLCDATQDGANNTPGIFELPDGRRFYLENTGAWTAKNRSSVPYSRRIEFLREEGPPTIEVDNSADLSSSTAGDNGCACSASETAGNGLASLLALLGLGGFALTRRFRGPNR